MRKTLSALIIVSVLFIAGCSTHQPPTPECPEGFDPTFRTELNGLTLIEATQKVERDGGEVRVAYNNGEHLALEDDLRANRVNLALDHNLVICSFPG